MHVCFITVIFTYFSRLSFSFLVKPLNVHITSLQRPLSAGRKVMLKCQSFGSKPPALLTWWIGSRQLLNTTAISYDKTSVSKLIYVPTPDDHNKVLSCRATNPVMDGNILEDHRVLNIHCKYTKKFYILFNIIFSYTVFICILLSLP